MIIKAMRLYFSYHVWTLCIPYRNIHSANFLHSNFTSVERTEPMMRSFLHGFPRWLRENLLIVEGQPLYWFVDQKVWHHRQYSGRVEKPLVSISSSHPSRGSITGRHSSGWSSRWLTSVHPRKPRRFISYHKVARHDASECCAVYSVWPPGVCGRAAQRQNAPPDRIH